MQVPVSPANFSSQSTSTHNPYRILHAVVVKVIVSHGAAVAVAAFTPRVVLWLSSCVWCCGCCRRAAWCRGCGRHAACGVTVAVAVPCGVVIAGVVVALHVVVAVSWSRSSRRVVLRGWLRHAAAAVLVATSSPHVTTMAPLWPRSGVPPW